MRAGKEPLQVVGGRAAAPQVNVQQLSQRRHPPAGRRVLLVGCPAEPVQRVGEHQQPGEVRARIADPPDLPVDDRHRLLAQEEHVADPVVPVQHARPHIGGQPFAQPRQQVSMAVADAIADSGEEPGPPAELPRNLDGRLG
jgi:hypothetical protein